MDSGCSVGSPIALQFYGRIFQQGVGGGGCASQQGGWMDGDTGLG